MQNNWRKKIARIYNKKYRLEHYEEIGIYTKQYDMERYEERKKSLKLWRRLHPEKTKASKAKRRNLDFILLNEYQREYVGHHLDKTYVIYIPVEVHRSIWHNQFTGQGMNEINALAFNYL